MSTTRFFTLATVVVLAACGDTTADAPEAVVRDSAGVAIVENPAPGEATPLWTVDSMPSLEIGMLEGPPEYQLESVYAAARLSDGTIVVPDAGAQMIRFYDATGRHLRSLGGEGSGPGEFHGLGPIWVDDADTVRAYDWNEARVTVVAPNGEFVRTQRLEPPAGVEFRLRPVAQLRGSLLSVPGRGFRPGSPAGLSRDTLPLYLHASDGAVVDSLGPWPQNESFVIADENSVTVTSRAFGRSTSYATHGDLLYVADPDRWLIEVHDTAGLRRVIRTDVPNRPVTQADIDELRRQRLENVEEEWRAMTERLLSEMSYPETMPAFGGMRVDEQGFLWVADYRANTDAERAMWSVFDPDGRLHARVTLPAGLSVSQIGADWVLGVWSDDLDVPHVRMHRLTRGAAAE